MDESSEIQKNFTYILLCSDGTLYTGWTNDLDKRIAAHNSGNGAKYTKSRLPVELFYVEEHCTKAEAMSREWQIKHMTRSEKLGLNQCCIEKKEESVSKK